MLEGEEGDVGQALRKNDEVGGDQRRAKFPQPDAERQPRSAEDMRKDAEWLAREMETDAQGVEE